MIANLLLLVWSAGWGFIIHEHGKRRGSDPHDAAAFLVLAGFPAVCVLAARHLP